MIERHEVVRSVESTPSDIFVDLLSVPSDPLYDDQWHLHGAWGINVESVWDDYTGRGVAVVVFDDGVDFLHPDLDDNYDSGNDLNAETGVGNGAPPSPTDAHGTAVAGLIAAERNGIGGVGVAYDATICPETVIT